MQDTSKSNVHLRIDELWSTSKLVLSSPKLRSDSHGWGVSMISTEADVTTSIYHQTSSASLFSKLSTSYQTFLLTGKKFRSALLKTHPSEMGGEQRDLAESRQLESNRNWSLI